MKFSFGSIKLGVRAEETPATPTEETPFRIAVLGDFSGKGTRPGAGSGAKLSGLRPVAVDRDNVETAMARLGVELNLPVAGVEAGITLRFKEMDDFRPERIFQQVEAFARLRETRRKLSNPATFAAAAEELRGWSKKEPEPAPAPPKETGPAVPLPTGEALLDAILGETSRRAQAEPAAPGGADLNAFLKKVVSAHVVPREDPRQAELVGQIDAAIGELMRGILHHPYLQALEALWRGLYFLVRRLDTDTQLKLFLLDVSQADLEGDLLDSDDLTGTGMYRLLVEQTVGTPGAPPWAVLVGHYSFGAKRKDVELLGRLAILARRAGAPFLAAAKPRVVGCESFGATPDPADWEPLSEEDQEAWQTLRQLPVANYLGLALPRFLLRLPYGKDTDPIEAFDFEELPQARRHEAYLWGNPAIMVAYLLGETFSRRGWSMQPGSIQDVDNLPAHVYLADGESEMKPCAEAVLASRAVERILDQGLMPLLSVQGRDLVRLASFRSLAVSGESLAGRWR